MTDQGTRPPDELHAPRFAIVPEWLLVEAPNVVKLYAVLDRYANTERQVWPGQATLAERMECSDRTVRTLLKRLEEVGALREEKRRWNGTTVYTLLPVRPETGFRLIDTDRKPGSAQTGSQFPPNESQEREKRSLSREAPDSFQISGAMLAWGTENAPGIDHANETAAFLDYHRAKGSKFKDWEAAWRKWMRNAVKYQSERNGSSPKWYEQPQPKWGVDA